MMRTGGTEDFLRMMDETQFERYWLVIEPMTFRSAMIPLIAAEVSPNPTGSTPGSMLECDSCFGSDRSSHCTKGTNKQRRDIPGRRVMDVRSYVGVSSSIRACVRTCSFD